MKNIEERRNRTIAREANYHASMRAPHIDKTAISPYDDYCDGYGMPGAYGNGYVSVLKVSAGTVEKTNDALIDTIVTYDKAETADAYIGQINMLTASSFCGMAGQVWGYDLARHDDITSGKSQPLFTEKQFDGSELKVFDAAPLLDAGIELFGTEVKSIRAGTLNLKDSFGVAKDGEIYAYSLHISPYEQGNIFNRDPDRPKRLLLHKREIRKLHAMQKQDGYALIPLSVYFKNSRVKVELGLCKGKKTYDKRDAVAKRDAKREMDRAMREKNRG